MYMNIYKYILLFEFFVYIYSEYIVIYNNIKWIYIYIRILVFVIGINGKRK